ncbi:MAG: MBL fold metallo-hydrolase [Acidobacteriia bacterium]|nr:MBL fold metallo-hydrolase [Terriglobia bacterium]
MTTIRSSLIALAALAAMTTSASAQGQPDFSKVEIKTTRISGNFYTLEGQGGVIGVLAGPDGVLMVDSQFAPLTNKIVAAVRQITDRPIRFLVNTHVHPDHTGGNENLGKMGVTIFAREELRSRLAHPAAPPNGNAPPAAPAAALPLVTYTGRVTFHMNGEEVQLIPIPRAHTDGDTLVRFPASDIIMTGDFYRSVQFPNIDRTNGGSLNGMLDGLAFIIGQSGPNTKIIPGHGPIVDRSAVAAHRDMLLAIRDRVARMVEQGMTQEQVLAAKPASDYDSKVQQPGTTGDRFIGQLYAELKTAK